MAEYSTPLDKDGWSEHYNIKILDSVVNDISTGSVSVWTKELVDICAEGTSCLEIGCGTGISSLWLAKNGRSVTALDYTQSSVELVKAAARKLNLSNVEVLQADATKDLPFGEKSLIIFFRRVCWNILRRRNKFGCYPIGRSTPIYMISMIPNAASIPYRVDKQIMEEQGTWGYGLEIPKHSMAEEFVRAGITIEREYTIGTQWAQNFLPKKHYIRKFFARLEKDGFILDDFMQGYLLVTIGKC